MTKTKPISSTTPDHPEHTEGKKIPSLHPIFSPKKTKNGEQPNKNN